MGVVGVKLLTVVLQESQYEWLAEMGREDKLSPSQVLVTIVGGLSQDSARAVGD